MKWHKDYLARVKQSIADAKKEASLANYLSESGANAGLRAIYSKRSIWLYEIFKKSLAQTLQIYYNYNVGGGIIKAVIRKPIITALE